MKKKVAILCAYPATRNTGMITVDLAAHAIFKRYIGEIDYSFYTYGDLADLEKQNLGLPINYKHIINDKREFLDSDAFIFWGDFIHAKSYQIDLRFRKCPEDEIEQLLRLSFLADVEASKLKNSIIYGGTIITNESLDYTDLYYLNMFERLFEKSGTVLFRDALSAAKVSYLRSNESNLGCDCALLLRDEDLRNINGIKLEENTNREGIGFFLSRSPAKIQSCFFAPYLALKMNKKITWLNWLPVSRKMELVAKLFGFNIPVIAPQPSQIITELSSYELIISDTYHLCVNAWRLGIPAICIGEGSGNLKTTLNDKKKEVLFEMYGGRRFYVFTEHIKTIFKIPSLTTQIIETLSNKALIEQFKNTLKQNITMSENRLKKAIDKIINN